MLVDAPSAPARPSLFDSMFGRYAWKARNAMWELWLNVSTGGAWNWDSSTSDSRYATLPYRAFFAMLDNLKPTASDVVIDIGCGKGRFLACAARRKVRAVVGVEINVPLAEMARKNVARMRWRKAPIGVVAAPAQEVDLSYGTVFYVYDSFGPGILRAVMENVRKSAQAGRPVRFAYASPRHEWVLKECDWLEQYDAWPARPDLGANHAVSFWRSRPELLAAQPAAQDTAAVA